MKDIPSSVYRVQLNDKLTFKKLEKLLPYLFDLGVEGIYCSPIFEAYSHGYDITNPNRLNPVLGSKGDFEKCCLQMQKLGLKHILDVVPNHMSIKGKNRWWLDVLENGPHSAFADFFDINWNSEQMKIRGKLLLPILNEPYSHILQKKRLRLYWDEGFWIHYLDYIVPICYSSYQQILEGYAEEDLNFLKLNEKEQFLTFCKNSKSLQEYIKYIVPTFNKDKNRLHALLEKQFYRLAYWTVAGQEINYRRFFNINDLAAICIEKENVLQCHHRLIFELIDSGKVQGLRIDHPDGLYDPSQYFQRLQQKKPGIIWIEKILDFGEKLPSSWDIDGTVGYDFLNILSGVFVEKKNEQKISEIYYEFIGNNEKFKKIHYERRKQYTVLNMSSEINYLGFLLYKISEISLDYRDFTQIDLTRACLEVVACFPVYRTYIKRGIDIRKKDRIYILNAVKNAKTKAPEISSLVFDYINDLLLLNYEFSPEGNSLALDFLLRFQQLTPPVMAKGLEDSTFYIYNRLISLNEVGGNPYNFGHTKEEFHEFNKQKLIDWPYGLLSSSTHDTKYSEDARLRINILSEMPKEWDAFLRFSRKKNEKYKTVIENQLIPDPNTEYFIYQMLLALWPTDFERLWSCLNKAIRQAGIHTSWKIINHDYEEAVKKFLKKILSSMEFTRFQKKVADYGYWSSLSALVLKIGSCGVVDIYQGNEMMNFALMDPDNRGEVDFRKRKKALKEGEDLKIFVTAQGLNFRKKNKELFITGDYQELITPENVIAFIRKWKKYEIIVIAKRFFSQKTKEAQKLKLPKNLQNKKFIDIFTGIQIDESKNELDLTKVFKKYPFAILEVIKR